jgi:hypothetical protein
MKSAMRILILVAALISLPAMAAHKPYKPHPFYKDKQFWLGTAVIAAGVANDIISTTNGNYPGLGDASIFLPGSGPYSNAKFAGAAAGEFAVFEGLHILLYHLGGNLDSRGWREFARWGIPGAAVGETTYAAITNYGYNNTYRAECRQMHLICEIGKNPVPAQ